MLHKQTKNMIRLATAMIGFAAAMGGALSLVTIIALTEGADQPGLERPFATALIVSLTLAILAYFVSRTLGPRASLSDEDHPSLLETGGAAHPSAGPATSPEADAQAHLDRIRENIHNRLMDTSCGAVAVLSAKYRILEISAAALTLLRARPIDAIGENFVDRFVAEPDREFLTNALDQVLTGIRVRGLDVVMTTNGGTRCEMRWNLDPLHDADGQVAAILAVGSDITDLMYLSEQLRQRSKLNG